MSILEEAQEQRFWLEWEDRFTDNVNYYINPDHPSVTSYAASLDVSKDAPREEIVNQLWTHIDNRYEYNLTKKWKQPQEAIRKKSGDCEDYVFLLGSLLPNFGINEFEVVIGEVKAGDRSEYHTWMRVDDRIVDPTTGPNEMDGLRYVEEKSFKVTVQP